MTMKNEVAVEINELNDAAVGVELSNEELQAVTGGRPMVITGFSGQPKQDDEWLV
jgi:bacteriocin-like protein